MYYILFVLCRACVLACLHRSHSCCYSC